MIEIIAEAMASIKNNIILIMTLFVLFRFWVLLKSLLKDLEKK
jgi:hypothetical protein